VVTGDVIGEALVSQGRSDRHSRHQTPPSPSPFAALSSLLPQPGCLSSSLRPFLPAAFFPPQTKQVACHLVPWGPGTTPLSIAETDLLHPGHTAELPKRGKDVVTRAVVGGGSEVAGFVDVGCGTCVGAHEIFEDGIEVVLELVICRILIFSRGAHCS